MTSAGCMPRACCERLVLNFFDATRHSRLCDNEAARPYTGPQLPIRTVNMEEPKYNASLIRMWRVWRTAKEMMNERVRCAYALDSQRAGTLTS
jgi:DNA-directed RNA polymerase I, II, and III subunit RPABC1